MNSHIPSLSSVAFLFAQRFPLDFYLILIRLVKKSLIRYFCYDCSKWDVSHPNLIYFVPAVEIFCLQSPKHYSYLQRISTHATKWFFFGQNSNIDYLRTVKDRNSLNGIQKSGIIMRSIKISVKNHSLSHNFCSLTVSGMFELLFDGKQNLSFCYMMDYLHINKIQISSDFIFSIQTPNHSGTALIRGLPQCWIFEGLYSKRRKNDATINLQLISFIILIQFSNIQIVLALIIWTFMRTWVQFCIFLLLELKQLCSLMGAELNSYSIIKTTMCSIRKGEAFLPQGRQRAVAFQKFVLRDRWFKALSLR